MCSNKIRKTFLGIGISVLIASIAIWLGNLFPIIGGSIFALAIGMILSIFFNKINYWNEGLNFVSKKVLKLAIILLGTSISITQVLEVGKFSLFVMIFTLSSAFIGSWLIGKMLNINWKMSSLIGAGTGICGGSAIATISPVIDADDTDIAYAMSATFIFDVIMIFLFPIMGTMLGLSDIAYGLWTGTAVNDTSSVVAAGYAFSEAAGNFSIIVKLTRTTSIVPITLIFSVIAGYKATKSEHNLNKKTIRITEIFPWFILLFLVSSMMNTAGLISSDMRQYLIFISKFFMAMALGAIGLKTNMDKILKTGMRPMFLGFIVSFIVVIVSISVQFFTGQV